MRSALKRSLERMRAASLLIAMPCIVFAEDSDNGVANGIALPVLQSTHSVPEPLIPIASSYQHIQHADQHYGVNVYLLHAIVKVESDFNTIAVSRSGAIGLIQIMHANAASFIGLNGASQSMRQQLMNLTITVQAGALYMRSLMITFSHQLDHALAACNAGISDVRKVGKLVLSNGASPQLVKKVTALYSSLKAAVLADEAAFTEASAFSPKQPIFASQ